MHRSTPGTSCPTSSAIGVNGHLPADQLTWYVNYGLEYGRKLSVIDYGRALGERDRNAPAVLGPVRPVRPPVSRPPWRLLLSNTKNTPKRSVENQRHASHGGATCRTLTPSTPSDSPPPASHADSTPTACQSASTSSANPATRRPCSLHQPPSKRLDHGRTSDRWCREWTRTDTRLPSVSH